MKPRNYVAKYAHMAGKAGPMRDRKRLSKTLRKQKHKHKTN